MRCQVIEEHMHFFRSTCLLSQRRGCNSGDTMLNQSLVNQGTRKHLSMCVVPVKGEESSILLKSRSLTVSKTKSNMVQRNLQHYNVFPLNLFSHSSESCCKQVLRTKSLVSNKNWYQLCSMHICTYKSRQLGVKH